MSNYFYITTAIDYPNGAPHMGHVYEKVVSDAYARWYRWLGKDVRFLTGTDENGQKLVKGAEEAGFSTTEDFINVNVEKFRKLCADLQITNDDFIRTTEDRHKKVCADLWEALQKKGDIYFDRYSGWYCLGCEAFYLESQAPELKCPTHGTKLEHMEEDGFFLRTSKYQAWIVEHIRTHENFIFPSSARKEILSRIENEPLRDLSVSRPNEGWGIPVPSNKDHVMYTWFDALINYYAAVINESELKHYWPASMHVIGKDITWFHTVIWPIMLHAAGVAVPEQVHVHGMVLAADGRRMSKTLKNSFDPYEIIGTYPNDLLRYYLLRAFSSGQDGSFAIKDLIARNNNELANDFGNLALRVIKLSAKRTGDTIDRGSITQDLDATPIAKDMVALMDAREHSRALDKLWEFVNQVNAYLNVHEPWRIKDDEAKFKHYMYNAMYAVYAIACLLEPFVPEAAGKTLRFLGMKNEGLTGLEFTNRTFSLSETESLFPKIEPEKD